MELADITMEIPLPDDFDDEMRKEALGLVQNDTGLALLLPVATLTDQGSILVRFEKEFHPDDNEEYRHSVLEHIKIECESLTQFFA